MSFYDKVADYIKKHEGYRDNAYWDVNAYRIGYGSDTITTSKSGAYRKVVKGDVTTKEMATIDLARRIKNEFEKTLINQVGKDNYNKLPENTKIALLSLVYNYGSITKKDIIEAIKTGDTAKIAKAVIDTTVKDNKGINAKRRMDEASLISSSVAYVKKNPLPFAIGAVVLVSVIGYFVLIKNKK